MRLLRYLPRGVLALLVGGVAGFWWLGGDEAQRWLARNALEIALDRPVVIDGTLEVELGTAPMLQLTGLRIDNPSWAEAPTMLRIERAEVQIALRPLLERVVLLPRIALQGVASISRPPPMAVTAGNPMLGRVWRAARLAAIRFPFGQRRGNRLSRPPGRPGG